MHFFCRSYYLNVLQKESKRILFLYSELAEYFVSALRYLVNNEHNIDVKVVHWPINPEAPFKFDFPESIEFIDKSKLSFQELSKITSSFNPHTIISSGWMDKDYLKICKENFKKSTTVVSLDNQYTGSLKQNILSFISPFYLKKIFKNAWVPGDMQLKYAHKLGFSNAQSNFYAPNIEFYQKAFAKTIKPHRFIYVGRYVEHKGIFDLWEAFIRLKKELISDWELWCFGVGDEYENRLEHPSIKHFGFVQPYEMMPYLKDSGVFVLPSKFEPWGVVVHEMAAAGFPMLLSDKIGSKSAFLKEGVNGYVFKNSSVDEIKTSMKKIIQKSDQELLHMGEQSFKLANNITQKKWVEALMSF